MKMLKKMAALLLAGVMALALFTACGDEAPAKEHCGTGRGCNDPCT